MELDLFLFVDESETGAKLKFILYDFLPVCSPVGTFFLLEFDWVLAANTFLFPVFGWIFFEFLFKHKSSPVLLFKFEFDRKIRLPGIIIKFAID